MADEKLENAPDFPGLEFDESTHTYRFDGVAIPSVSKVMEPLSGVKYAGINQKTMERAAAKGSSVHESIELFVAFGTKDVNPEHGGYFDAFMDWWNERKPSVVAAELRVYHSILQYGGTLDLLAYIDGKLTLVDYKTTSAVSDMTWGVQLEAYDRALASHGIDVDEKLILHLRKNGAYKEFPYKAKDTKRWRVFESLKRVYDYVKAYK